MSRIPYVEPENASEEVRTIYDRFQAGGMPLLNVIKLFGNDAGFLAGLEQMSQSLYADSVLSPRYRELAYLRASQLNSCHY
jgi:alkylhydroperoxidase family enzyme